MTDDRFDDLHRYRRRHAAYGADDGPAGHRLWRYLRSRPAETWLFFGAGFVLASLIG